MGIETAILGSAIIGGVGSAMASKSAAKAQQQASDAAAAEQRRQYDLTRQDMQPWMQAGQNALMKLQDPAANFQTDPGYAFLRSEGLRGIERSAAARGGAFSGNALKALTQFNSGLADQSYGNWWSRQAGLAGVGQTTASNLGAYGQNSANSIGNSLLAGGDARASGIMGVANSISGAANTGLNNWLLYKGGYFNKAGG